SGILALQTPKFYLAGSKRARKSGFLRSIDCKNPQFEQALRQRRVAGMRKLQTLCIKPVLHRIFETGYP
ncbi:MAG: hypothetical protein LBD18_00160, partial [Treponema sp.]|nr:hypothetical protein [Treponema sp.]